MSIGSSPRSRNTWLKFLRFLTYIAVCCAAARGLLHFAAHDCDRGHVASRLSVLMLARFGTQVSPRGVAKGTRCAMDKIGRGIIAGFLATIALSAMLDPIA